MACSRCGNSPTTKAHVYDRSLCEEDGIHRHEFLNIIDLCYPCHYNLFDSKLMGIANTNNCYYFVSYNKESNKVEIMKSKTDLNVRPEYILYKNRNCIPKLWVYLFRPEKRINEFNIVQL